MLVLSRKKTEAIVIDGGIKITVLEVAGNSVRIGIEAPQSVSILRNELAEGRLGRTLRRHVPCPS